MNSLLTALGVLMASSGALPVSQTWEHAVLASAPLSLWRCNETNTASLADVGSAAVALTRTGTMNTAKRLYPSTGAGVSPGTTSSYYTAASSAPYRLLGDLSQEFVFILSVLPASGGYQVLSLCGASGETEAANTIHELLIDNNAGVLGIRFIHEYGAGNNEDQRLAFPFVVGVAYHLVAVRDTVAKTYTFFVNNENIGSLSYSNNPTGGSTGTFFVGANLGISGGAAANTFQGTIDEIAFYDRKLSAMEVASHWAGLLYKMEAETDDFSADTASLYTSAGDSAATWSVSGGKMTATGGVQAVLLRNGLYSNRISCKMTRADDAGMILRYQDNNNYYVLVICDASSNSINPNKVLIYKRVGGTYTLIGPAVAISFTRGVESKFEFIAIGSRLIVKHNDATVMQVTDTSLPATGLAGLRSNVSATPSIAEFTDFTWRAVDPFFNNVVLLAHMDGLTLEDEVGHTISGVGGAAVSTTGQKFGTGCTDFNAVASQYVESTSADYNIAASQSFCVEFWRKQGARTLQENYMECGGAVGTNPSGRWQIYHANSNDAPIFWSSSASNILTMTTAMPRDGQYHHEAWARQTSTLRAFLDGAAAGSGSTSAAFGQSNLRWGTFENPTPVDQTYDEIRITVGQHRYAAAFARPSIPFPNGAHA